MMVAVQLFTWKPLVLLPSQSSRLDRFASFNRSLSLKSLPLGGIGSFRCPGEVCYCKDAIFRVSLLMFFLYYRDLQSQISEDRRH
jgi:hypothetical protein